MTRIEYPDPYHPQKVLLHSEKLETLNRGELVAPVTIEVDLTDGACNQACSHCTFHSGDRRDMMQIPADTLLSTLEEARRMGTRGLELVGGGEPTMHRDFETIIEGALDIGMEIGLITNGVLAHRAAPYASRMKYVRISLDSADTDSYNKLHGVPPTRRDHARVIENIQLLRKSIPLSDEGDNKLGVGYLVVPPINHTLDQIEGAASLCDELGVDYIAYRPAHLSTQQDTEQWHTAQRSIALTRQMYRDNRLRIYGGSGNRWNTLEPNNHPTGTCLSRPLVAVIQANGDIAHCILHRDNRDLKIGNITEGSFAEQWMGDLNQERLRTFQVEDCPNPCKHYGYNEQMVNLRRNPNISVLQSAVDHHNHV